MKSVPVGLRSPGTLEFSVIVRWPKPKMLGKRPANPILKAALP